MLDADTPWNPRAREDEPITEMLRHVFAWNGANDFERGFLTDGPYGDIFDVVTNAATPRALSRYPVLWPLGASVNERHRDALMQYVKQGGILVLDAVAAGKLPKKLTRVKIGDTRALATQVQTALTPLPPAEAPFVYRPLEPVGNSEAFAWTDAGAPLAVWRRYGEGVVIVCGTDGWLDKAGNVLPLAARLLGLVAETFLPVQPPPGMETLLTSSASGWTVACINNTSVAKAPTRAATSKPAEAFDLDVLPRGRLPLKFEAVRGEIDWNSKSMMLRCKPGAGETSVVRIVTGSKS
jgi:hypothetical protein